VKSVVGEFSSGVSTGRNKGIQSYLGVPFLPGIPPAGGYGDPSSDSAGNQHLLHLGSHSGQSTLRTCQELPGVAAHDPLFVLLRRVILRSCTARHGNSWAQ